MYLTYSEKRAKLERVARYIVKNNSRIFLCFRGGLLFKF
jgi:hypothetical protein